MFVRFVYVIFRQVELLHLYNIYENTDEFIACVLLLIIVIQYNLVHVLNMGEGWGRNKVLSSKANEQTIKSKMDSVYKSE